MTNQHPNLTNQLCFSIYTANRLVNQFYSKSLKPFGLTYTQYLVLLALWENDGQPLHKLGRQLDLASNTLTPLLKRLEDKGYLLRLRPDKDQRQLIVQLTQQGKQLQTEVEKVLHSCLSDLMPASPEKIQQMIAENQRLTAALKSLL